MFKHPRKVASAVQDEVIGVLGEVFSYGLLYMSESQLNALARLGLRVVKQCGISHLLGLDDPNKVAFGSGTTYRHPLHGIW